MKNLVAFLSKTRARGEENRGYRGAAGAGSAGASRGQLRLRCQKCEKWGFQLLGLALSAHSHAFAQAMRPRTRWSLPHAAASRSRDLRLLNARLAHTAAVAAALPAAPLFPQVQQVFSDKAHLGVVGPNASGKRTLLLALQAHAEAAGLGVEVVDFRTHRQTVGQTPGDTVARVLGGFANADVVIRFGLTPVWWRALGSLSTGEIRKVILARAVTRAPDVLIMDRPFDGLDARSRDALLVLLEDLTSGRTEARPLVQGVKWYAWRSVRAVGAEFSRARPGSSGGQSKSSSARIAQRRSCLRACRL
jgi:hypothetical protein